MANYEQTSVNKVKRGANRATYDVDQINEILDDGFLCHIGYNFDKKTVVIPTAYGRYEDKIYVHGAIANRMLGTLLKSGEASITVTHLDGLVLARSAFHHSANYRSAAIFGSIAKVEIEEAKLNALKIIMDQMLPGRWDECREPNQKELKATLVLEITIEYASAKIRQGGPVDDDEDYNLLLWAGELPIEQRFNQPIDDALLAVGISQPLSVLNFN